MFGDPNPDLDDDSAIWIELIHGQKLAQKDKIISALVRALLFDLRCLGCRLDRIDGHYRLNLRKLHLNSYFSTVEEIREIFLMPNIEMLKVLLRHVEGVYPIDTANV